MSTLCVNAIPLSVESDPLVSMSVTEAFIEDGGGWDEDDIADRAISGAIIITKTKVRATAFFNCSGITSISCPDVTEIEEYAFAGCSGVTSASFPKLKTIGWRAFNTFGTSQCSLCLPACTSLVGPSHLAGVSSTAGSCFGEFKCSSIVMPKYTSGFPNWSFNGNTNLVAADLTPQSTGTNMFNGCSALITIVLRRTSIVALTNVNCFDGTPFASGGTGGTIYIPKALYDHLGDGTSSDYKAATNWSTINGYGTITWAKIEGSQYENTYVDGTPIT